LGVCGQKDLWTAVNFAQEAARSTPRWLIAPRAARTAAFLWIRSQHVCGSSNAMHQRRTAWPLHAALLPLLLLPLLVPPLAAAPAPPPRRPAPSPRAPSPSPRAPAPAGKPVQAGPLTAGGRTIVRTSGVPAGAYRATIRADAPDGRPMGQILGVSLEWRRLADLDAVRWGPIFALLGPAPVIRIGGPSTELLQAVSSPQHNHHAPLCWGPVCAPLDPCL
jgi:hypothetical protein